MTKTLNSFFILGLLAFAGLAFSDTNKPDHHDFDHITQRYPTPYIAQVEKQEALPIATDKSAIIVNDGFFEALAVFDNPIDIIPFAAIESYVSEHHVPLTYPLISTAGIKEFASVYPKRLLLFHIDIRDNNFFRVFIQDLITNEKYFVASIDLNWQLKASKHRKEKIYALYNALGDYLKGRH